MLFFITWTLYSASSFILGSELAVACDLDALREAISYASLLLLLISLLLLDRYTKTEIIKYLVFLAVIFLVEITITERALLIYVFFMILAQHIDVEKLLRYDIKLKVCMLIVIVGMCAAGVIDNYSDVINGTYKQAWGFQHPNTFTCYVLTILVEWLCVRYGKMKWYEWLLVIGCALAVEHIGGGRSSVYTFAVIFLLFVLAAVVPKLFYTKLVKLAFAVVTPLLAALSFLAVWLYNQGNAFAIKLNSILTTRISLASRFLNTYDLKIFGQEIEYISTRQAQIDGVSSNILDNAYIHCALSWGILIFAAIIIGCCGMLRKWLKNKQVNMALFSLFFILLGIGETYMLNPLYNVSFLCLLGCWNAKEGVMISQKCPSRRGLAARECQKS